MDVKTWKGGTYGIRVGRQNAQKYFNKTWGSIEVKIENNFYTFKLNSTFWTTCPEFRGGPIPRWLKENRLDNWPKSSPHQVKLGHLGDNRFELSIK